MKLSILLAGSIVPRRLSATCMPRPAALSHRALIWDILIPEAPLTVSVQLSSAPLTPPILTALKKLIHFINLN